MIRAVASEINVDELMAKIGEEVARRNASESGEADGEGELQAFQLHRFNHALNAAESHANIGLVVPPMRSLGRCKRWLGQRVGRVILNLGQIITTPQRRFNLAVIHAFRVLGAPLERLSSAVARQQVQVEQLRAEIAELRLRLDVQSGKLGSEP